MKIRHKFTNEQWNAICQEYLDGHETQESVARKYDVPLITFSQRWSKFKKALLEKKQDAASC